MKNLKALGIVGLGCGLLFLTGCGNSHTLKCEMSDDQQEIEIELKFNDEETKVENVDMKVTIKAEDGTSDEEMSQAKEMLEGSCDSLGLDTCKVDVNGTKLVMTMSGSASSMDLKDGTLEEVKKSAEDDGYTCK